MFDFFPEKIRAALGSVASRYVYEIRLRADQPIVLNYDSRKVFLGINGITDDRAKALTISSEDVKNMLPVLCERSVYAYADKIKNGYITLKNGVRIGLCGECVIENGQIINLINVSSLNVRIPHRVDADVASVLEKFKNETVSVLAVSPPGAGKTTYIRTLAEKLSEKYRYDILICDERNEIFPQMKNVSCVDCITYSPKRFAFENGIRAMSPQIIVTDEIVGEADAEAVYNAVHGGVSVIATVHGRDLSEVFEVEKFKMLKGVFDYFVTIDESNGKGTVKSVITKKEAAKL